MPSIARPQKVYDFTDHARRQPTAPPPGDRIDAQLANHADAIAATQLAVEQLQSKQTQPVDVEGPARAIIAQAERAAQEIRRTAGDAAAIVDQAKFELRRIWDEARRAVDVADRAEARLAAAVHAAQAEPAPAPNFYPGQAMPSLGYGAGGPYAGDDAGAAAVSADYAQVAIEWAEHMPDTIPPNILAVNAISGDHWSSRWWANKAAQAMGGATVWSYLGAYHHADAPSHTPTGDPLEPGMTYYDIDLQQMMVWNGDSWQSTGNPQPGITASFYYLTAAGQTVFSLATADKFGRVGQIEIGQAVLVYLNGVRQTPQDDFAMDQPSSTITLQAGAPAGLILAIDLLVLPNQLAHGVALAKKIKPLIPAPDGTRTTFTLQSADGSAFAVSDSAQAQISVNGVWQEPVVAYTIAVDQITFSEAPEADAYVFGVWFTPAT
jgi:hypothetical protein